MYNPVTSLAACTGLLLRHGRRKFISNVCLKSTTTSQVYIRYDPKFTPIYKLPIVQGCSVVNRFKKLNFVLQAGILPLTFAAYKGDIFLDADLPLSIMIFGLVTTSITFCIGQAVNRLVGVIYVSKDNKQVMISYIDFWGSRQDEIHSVNDIKPLEECPKPLDLLYMKLKTESTKPYLINFKYGMVLNSKLFYDIFGYNSTINDY